MKCFFDRNQTGAWRENRVVTADTQSPTTFSMLPLFKYFVNTVVLAPLLVKHLLKQEADWSQVLNVLGLATVLNVAAGARIGKPCLKV